MFCSKCGTNISENEHFCPNCGEPVRASAPINDESDRTAMFAPEDADRTRYLSALCYVSFLFMIIALLLEPNSKFLRYHINQSIILTVFGLLCGLAAIVPFIGWIASVLGCILVFVFSIMGIVRAIKREARDLPLIGKYVIVHYD